MQRYMHVALIKKDTEIYPYYEHNSAFKTAIERLLFELNFSEMISYAPIPKLLTLSEQKRLQK